MSLASVKLWVREGKILSLKSRTKCLEEQGAKPTVAAVVVAVVVVVVVAVAVVVVVVVYSMRRS